MRKLFNLRPGQYATILFVMLLVFISLHLDYSQPNIEALDVLRETGSVSFSIDKRTVYYEDSNNNKSQLEINAINELKKHYDHVFYSKQCYWKR